MKKLILHVGSGKAGSTSIQRALIESQEVNKDLFTYPVISDSPGNQILRFAFCDVLDTPINVRSKYLKLGPEAYKNYQENIKNEIAIQVANSSAVVLSSEFWFISSEEEIFAFKQFIEKLGFSEVHVIMYLRDPAKYYLSVAQQSLKNQPKMPKPDNFRYKMLEAVKNWMLLNPTSMTIREFDRSKLLDGDVVTDFNQYLNIFDLAANLKLTAAQNESLSSEATQAIQDFYQYCAENEVSKAVMDVALKKIRLLIRSEGKAGNKPVLKLGIASFIYNSYLRELNAINKGFDIFGETVFNSNNVSCSSICDVKDFLEFRDIVEDFDEVVYQKYRNYFIE
jgi:hypothetical protein